jgi:DNA-binding NtrC family response regulator
MNENKETILVVEDERPLLEAIRLKLTSSGFDVVTARSAEEAKNHIQDINTIKVIWLDHYLLGKETGLDFIHWCKNSGTYCKKIPVFVVSNTATPEKVKTYIHLGVNKYYVKAEKRLDDIIKDIKEHLANPEKEEKDCVC